MADEKSDEKAPEFIDPNSGAAPQPGGFVSGQPVPEEESDQKSDSKSDGKSTPKKSTGGNGGGNKSTGKSSDKS